MCGRMCPKVTLLMALFCSLVTLSHLVKKFYEGFPYCVMVVDMACSCLIGLVWILELYLAFTGGTEMSSSLVLFRGEALLVCLLVIPYTGRTISVSLLVLNQASS